LESRPLGQELGLPRMKKRGSVDKNKAIIVLSLIFVITVASAVTLYSYVQNSRHTITIISCHLTVANVSGINISPTIFSPQNNLAILNEAASFNFTVWNFYNDSLDVKLSVIGDDNLLYNESFNVPSQSMSSMIVRKTLCYSGLWLVTASTNDTTIGATYSFQTLTNAQEAYEKINYLANVANQQNSSNLSNTLALINDVINAAVGVTAVAALIIAIFAYRRKRVDPE
jgi:hypothetical protein